jgi:hypothetical protein
MSKMLRDNRRKEQSRITHSSRRAQRGGVVTGFRTSTSPERLHAFQVDKTIYPPPRADNGQPPATPL